MLNSVGAFPIREGFVLQKFLGDGCVTGIVGVVFKCFKLEK
jgi:hypothetical protein